MLLTKRNSIPNAW